MRCDYGTVVELITCIWAACRACERRGFEARAGCTIIPVTAFLRPAQRRQRLIDTVCPHMWMCFCNIQIQISYTSYYPKKVEIAATQWTFLVVRVKCIVVSATCSEPAARERSHTQPHDMRCDARASQHPWHRSSASCMPASHPATFRSAEAELCRAPTSTTLHLPRHTPFTFNLTTNIQLG